MHSTRCVRFGAIAIAILDVLVYFWAMAQIWICKYKSEHGRCHFFSRGCGLRWFSAGLATTKLNLFLFPFLQNHWFAWGANQWPLIGKDYSLPFLPATPSSLSQTLEGLFRAEAGPFKGPRLASCVASGTTDIQGHPQVCRTRRGGPRTPSTTTDGNLDCALVETHFFTSILDCEMSTE